MNLGEKLKNARALRHMSQDELARATGISMRTIQNYEAGTHLPKKRSTYEALAKALGIEEGILLDDNTDFVLRASEQYGRHGAKQAWDLVNDIRAMWAGGEMEEEDMDEIMRAMQEAYWEAKKSNKKYAGKRYRSGDYSDM